MEEKLMTMIVMRACLGLLLFSANVFAQYVPPGDSNAKLAGVDFTKAVPVDEAYRKTFLDCDNKPNSHCSDDKNNLKALLKFPDGTIYYESKMSLDLDGSYVGCGCAPAGKTDQCQTAVEWVPGKPTTAEYKGEKNKCKFYKSKAYVDAGKFPYFVLPMSSKFVSKTKLKTGDLAVVIHKDKIAYVFVGDRGPSEEDKIGEGSAELIRLLGEDKCLNYDQNRNCTRYDNTSLSTGTVLAFIFPNSKIRGLKPDTALKTIEAAAKIRFDKFKQSLR
jgi:Fungal chitosanase of glycosyl hydrolase group 75